jgi:pyridoxamine 5'-phosphate oxidase
MTMNALPDTAPGFDQPIAVLKHCHDRIRKQLATCRSWCRTWRATAPTSRPGRPLQAVIKYFDKAAHLHHADEEENLVPMLQSVAEGEDAATAGRAGPRHPARPRRDGRDVAAPARSSWRRSPPAAARCCRPPPCEQFARRYLDHMEREEGAYRADGQAPVQPGADGAIGRGDAGAARHPPAPAGRRRGRRLRKDYGQATLNEADVAADPFDQFNTWFEQALAAEVNEPNAMSVATVDADGKPSSRIVLIKQFDRRGFTWYTNYDSQKGRQLGANPHAALAILLERT